MIILLNLLGNPLFEFQSLRALSAPSAHTSRPLQRSTCHAKVIVKASLSIQTGYEISGQYAKIEAANRCTLKPILLRSLIPIFRTQTFAHQPHSGPKDALLNCFSKAAGGDFPGSQRYL